MGGPVDELPSGQPLPILGEQTGGCLAGSVVITTPRLRSNGRSAASPLAGIRVYTAQAGSIGGDDGVGAKGPEVVSLGGATQAPPWSGCANTPVRSSPCMVTVRTFLAFTCCTNVL